MVIFILMMKLFERVHSYIRLIDLFTIMIICFLLSFVELFSCEKLIKAFY